MGKGFSKKLVRYIFLGVFVFVLSGLGTAYADTGRPLRRVPSDASLRPASVQKPAPAQLFVNSPLITPVTLAKPLVQRYIHRYSNPAGVTYLNALTERANIFMPFIRAEVEYRQLPPELMFLPVIESSFVITAVSRSGAVGLWQFMMNSIAPFNIRVTDYLDERRDFVKSTQGALRKLLGNYRTLGCWKLALAAYNAGLGGVRRTIQRAGTNCYWELSDRRELRDETRHFVPRLIAACYVLFQPRRFNINVWHEKFEWETIPLARQISIDLLAYEAGIDRNLLRRLNSELQHGITPPESDYRLVIPASHVEIVTAILERDDLQLLRYHRHIVRSGDTLWGISRHFGTSIQMIERHNPGIGNRYLRIGETIIIPALRKEEH